MWEACSGNWERKNGNHPSICSRTQETQEKRVSRWPEVVRRQVKTIDNKRRIYMDLCLAMLKAVSFYFLHNVSTLNQCRKLSSGTIVG
jgi:hypothetical protein